MSELISRRTIREEMKRAESAKQEAILRNDDLNTERWYAVEVALAWVLGNKTPPTKWLPR